MGRLEHTSSVYIFKDGGLYRNVSRQIQDDDAFRGIEESENTRRRQGSEHYGVDIG